MLERLVNLNSSVRDAKDHSEPETLAHSEHSLQTRHATNQSGDDNENHPWSSPAALTTPTTLRLSPGVSLASGYAGLAQDLVAAWPTQHDLDRIYELPVRLSTLSHMHLGTPTSSGTSWEPISAQELLQLPPPGSHPVLIARKLLLLGSLLQGTLSFPQLSRSTRDYFSKIMSRVIDTASKLVTTNDDLTASVEGIECIIIEGMIQNHTGKLHRSWQTIHRAATVAQIVGLHRDVRLPAPRILDPSRKDTYDPGQLCFRIVEMDRYLSVTLGLPQSSLETSALTNEAIARCQPLERMARLHCLIAGRLVTRQLGQGPGEDLTFINEIEQLLQQAASAMPPQWWLIPDYGSGHDGDAADPFQETARFNYQCTHYHFLVRLHLPYMLRSSKRDGIERSKIAAVHASRECLSRYIAFRRWNPGHFYCRGTDFLAFIALVVMCIAHVNCGSTLDKSAQSKTQIERMLAQSHLSDRGLMERTVHIMIQMEDDAIAMKLYRIMQHLLDVEADAANGVGYDAVSAKIADEAAEIEGGFVDDKNTLQLHIPYIGTIKFRRKPVTKPDETVMESNGLGSATSFTVDMLHDQAIPSLSPFSGWDPQWSLSPTTGFDASNPQIIGTGLHHSFDAASGFENPDDWTLQSINESLFSSLFSGLENHDTTQNM
jgi:hypothetical protein